MNDKKPAKTDDAFSVERVRELIDLMTDNELSEIILKRGEDRICLRKKGEPAPIAYAPAPAAAPMPAPAAAAPAASSGDTSAAAPAGDGPEIVYIKSPMVGTFYRSPNPDAPPFVKPGDRVTSETVVCVIEAMKMFTDMQAEVSGEIVAVLVENGDPVDVNKPLFKVDTSK